MKILSNRLIDTFDPLTASEAIRQFSDITRQQRLLLIERVSGCERLANLKNQDANLRKVLGRTGATVGGVFRYVGSGFDPFWIRYAVKKAIKLNCNGLLAETTDRYVRHPLFHAKDKNRTDFQAEGCHLRKLHEVAGGVPLYTHLDRSRSITGRSPELPAETRTEI